MSQIKCNLVKIQLHLHVCNTNNYTDDIWHVKQQLKKKDMTLSHCMWCNQHCIIVFYYQVGVTFWTLCGHLLTHHIEDGVNHEVYGHDGGRPPVLHWSHSFFISRAQKLRQTHQRGVCKSPRVAAQFFHWKYTEYYSERWFSNDQLISVNHKCVNFSVILWVILTQFILNDISCYHVS